ncbi:MAG: acyl carrier protein [Dehalococcoidales bacterium]|jgi:acyl carrier protein|nr:acyl carrier protein [Dehalococcoidales bacterium]
MAVFDEFRRSIARVTRTAENNITLETKLSDIKADSLHWVQIIIGTETALDIEIDVDKEKMNEMKTVGDFVAYIEKIGK